MTVVLVAVAAAMLPVMFALRAPYFRLPLHIDTGFYVSNHTVRTGRFRFARGWNARFAACSKVLPEAFYSAAYLVHGGGRYASASRVWLTVWLLATAVVVGLVAARVTGDPRAAVAGLVVFALVSCEPRYGIYFECAEPFELPFQALGTLAVFAGLEGGAPWLVAAGVGLWAAESFFVKLSSLPAAAVMGAGAAMSDARTLLPSLAVTAAVGALWLAWAVANGARPWALARGIAAHERYFGHRLALSAYVRTVRDKVRMLGHIVPARPVIPLLATIGTFAGPGPVWIVLLHLGAVAVAHTFQAAVVWYYAIPLLAPIALLAARGALALLDAGAPGAVVLGALAVAWLAQHLAGSWGVLVRGGVGALCRHVWKPHGAKMADKNLALAAALPRLRAAVGGKSLFVFGLWNQAYVLLDAAWDTSLVSAARWLDEMEPRWSDELNRRLVEDPPELLLDTDDCLDTSRLAALGLGYETVLQLAPSFRLLRLTVRAPGPSSDPRTVRLYVPRTRRGAAAAFVQP